jgi:type II secretory pathway predicted ATPase ExeA
MNKRLLVLYGLKWNPFSPEVPVEALWKTPAIEHFCRRLEHQVREGGFALITGDPGTGKSVALRLLAQHLSGLPEIAVGVLIRPQSRLADFYRELSELFGVPWVPHNRWVGFKAIREKWQNHLATTLCRPVLLIDEAQEMRADVLSEVRLLSSTDFDSRSILTVVLSGDARLVDHFRSPDLLPIGSRIRVRLNLQYVPPKDLADFLGYVLQQAGNPRLMTPNLIATLCEHAAGNYRVLCTMAAEMLAAGSERELPQLDEKLFLEVFSHTPKSRRRNLVGDPVVGINSAVATVERL